jgi:hypothetical protein
LCPLTYHWYSLLKDYFSLLPFIFSVYIDSPGEFHLGSSGLYVLCFNQLLLPIGYSVPISCSPISIHSALYCIDICLLIIFEIGTQFLFFSLGSPGSQSYLMLPPIAGITDVYHYAQFFSIEIGSHKFLLPGIASSQDPLDFSLLGS